MTELLYLEDAYLRVHDIHFIYEGAEPAATLSASPSAFSCDNRLPSPS